MRLFNADTILGLVDAIIQYIVTNNMIEKYLLGDRISSRLTSFTVQSFNTLDLYNLIQK